MAEEEIQQGQPPSNNGVAVQEPPVSPQVPEAEAKVEAPAAPAAKPWQETLDEIARTVPSEELRRHRLINDHAQSIAAKQWNEKVAKERESANEYNNAYQFEQQFNALTPDQKIQVLSDPDNATRHAKSMRLLQAGSVSAVAKEAALTEAREELESLARTDEDFKGVSKSQLDEALALPSLGQSLFRLARVAVEEERKQMQKDIKAEMDARFAELKQQVLGSAEEPERPAGGIVGGNGKVPTPQEYAAMSRDERAKAEASGEVDRWARAWTGQ